ncbi:MAG: hypothetical protein LBM98_00860 [Oscillospiraceae bacterium]|jgi:hypothetical protein|nr:hypothetical protein [Oscillospiraceae bacterium]
MDIKSGTLIPVVFVTEDDGSVSLDCPVMPVCLDYADNLDEGLLYVQSNVYYDLTNTIDNCFSKNCNPRLLDEPFSTFELPLEIEIPELKI